MRETKRKNGRKKEYKTRKNNRKIEQKIHGKRFPIKNGWIQVRIDGNATERGFAHGYLLAKELQEIKNQFAFILEKNGFFSKFTTFKTKLGKNVPFNTENANPSNPYSTFAIITDGVLNSYEKYCKEKITPIIQKDFLEYFEEMQAISAGAIAAGYPLITFDFIVAWNSLLSTYTYFPERCSSFITIQDGNIIMAHNTHTDLLTGQKANIVLEICPSQGHHMIMQTCPGFICSGTDFFIIENGIIGCESTIGNINYTPKFGAPYYCRIRQAMQYGNSLDDYVKIMLKNNAGDYPCTWLLGDTKRKEIMQLEIAKKTHAVERKTEGVFYGMNSVHDKTIRKTETNDRDYGNTSTSVGARNMRLHYLLYEKYVGKMTIENAKKIIADHYDVYLDKETIGNYRTICKHNYLDPDKKNYPFGCTDGKIVDTKMANEMSFLGRFGNSCGTGFNVKTFVKKHAEYKSWGKYLKNMPSQPWITLQCS